MYFGRQNNGTGNGVNTNTTFFTSYSDTAMVRVGGWNDNLSVRISPCTGKDANGVNQYAKETNQIIITSITPKNAIALSQGYHTELEPAIKEGRAAKVGVTMGSDNARKVLSIGFDGTDTYLEIVTNMSSEGLASDENILVHKFGTQQYLSNFSAVDGSGSQVAVNSEFELFMHIIDNVYELIPTVAHATRHSDAIRSQYAGRNNNNNQQSAGGNNNGGGYQAPVSNYDGEMNGFIPFS